MINFFVKLAPTLTTTSTTYLASNNNNNNRIELEPCRIQAAVDSEASDNYFPASYQGEAPSTSTHSHHIGTANGTTIQSVTTDQFPLAGVPTAARECKKFIEVALPLISVGRLCIHGLIVAFDAQHIYIFNKRGQLVNKGNRDPQRNLYMIPIEATKQQEPEELNLESAHLAKRVAANAYEIRAVPALISYHHASIGNIPKITFLQRAITGFYAGFPGLTPAYIRKYLTKEESETLESTTYGHQNLV